MTDKNITLGPDGSALIPEEDLKKSLHGLGFDNVFSIPGSTYKDSSTVVIVPSRAKHFHHRVVSSWMSMIAPMNQKKTGIMFCVGDEVGQAYDRMIKEVLAHPDLSKWKYVLTLEDDNIQPADAHIRLLETIEAGSYDAVGGLYFTRGQIGMPMCYGDPAEYKATGILDFRPRDIRNAISNGQVVPCNGLAMGCTLYRMSLFKEMEGPWFTTLNDVLEGKGTQCMTQDLAFCARAVAAGKRFACDTRVKVGHLDFNTGIVY